MELPRRLTIALHTLTVAVDLLEGAVEQSRREQSARLDSLLTANREVGTRLEQVATALRALADQSNPTSPDDPG